MGILGLVICIAAGLSILITFGDGVINSAPLLIYTHSLYMVFMCVAVYKILKIVESMSPKLNNKPTTPDTSPQSIAVEMWDLSPSGNGTPYKCPKCNCEMEIKRAVRGFHNGKEFMVCKCGYIESLLNWCHNESRKW